VGSVVLVKKYFVVESFRLVFVEDSLEERNDIDVGDFLKQRVLLIS
jgi:hypothetical protein